MNNKIIVPPNPANAPAELIERYNTNGPRYTSYPTAPHFSEDVDQQRLYARFKESNNSSNALSMYVHIPFCASRCWFCGCFTKISKDPAIADSYLNTLVKEFSVIASLIDPNREIKQLAFGGGTPTFLTPDRFDKMMRELKSVWRIADDAELSVEIDPRTILDEHVDVLLEHGFNRFSLGVQDFNKDVLEAIHRAQSLDQTMRLVDTLRANNQQAINFDLIYGLPGQSVHSMEETARKTVEIGPSRIALYSYAHVPWMKGHQKILEKQKLPDAKQKLALFGMAYDILTDGGYIPVGMDHFARADDELVKALSERSLHRNFMGYTTRRGLDLMGFGASAISSVAGTYQQNTKDFEKYENAIESGKTAIERGYVLSREDQIRRELIIDLFCNFYLDFESFSARWDIDFSEKFSQELENLLPFEKDKLLDLDQKSIAVTPLGRAFVRNICMVFDVYLEDDPALRRYSKTV